MYIQGEIALYKSPCDILYSANHFSIFFVYCKNYYHNMEYQQLL